MQAEHAKELNAIPSTPMLKIIYALGMLSDVVDGDMVGEDRDLHVNDAKEIIILACREAGLS